MGYSIMSAIMLLRKNKHLLGFHSLGVNIEAIVQIFQSRVL